MLLEEPDDLGRRIHEGCREDGKRGLPDNDQQSEGMTPDGGKLVRLVADSPIVCNCDPALPADFGKPLFIGASGGEMVPMAFHTQPRSPQNLGKSEAKVSVGEEDNAQATRS
jgi:hypothetical protein